MRVFFFNLLQNLPLCLFNLFLARVVNDDTVWKYGKYTITMVSISFCFCYIKNKFLPVSNALVTLRAHSILCNFDSSRPIKHQLFLDLKILLISTPFWHVKVCVCPTCICSALSKFLTTRSILRFLLVSLIYFSKNGNNPNKRVEEGNMANTWLASIWDPWCASRSKAGSIKGFC